MKKSTSVPTAPFAELLEERVRITGVTETARFVGLDEKLVRNIINGAVKNIHFSSADKIVTRLYGPMRWYEDPVLEEIYLGADLRSLDWVQPVSETVRQEIKETAIQAYKEEGKILKAARKCGVAVTTFERYIPRIVVRKMMKEANGGKAPYENPNSPWPGRVFYGGRWRTPEEVEHQRERMRRSRTVTA